MVFVTHQHDIGTCVCPLPLEPHSRLPPQPTLEVTRNTGFGVLAHTRNQLPTATLSKGTSPPELLFLFMQPSGSCFSSLGKLGQEGGSTLRMPLAGAGV